MTDSPFGSPASSSAVFSPIENHRPRTLAVLVIVMGIVAGASYYYVVSPTLGLQQATQETFQPQPLPDAEVPKVNLPPIKPFVQPKPIVPACTNECQRVGQIRGCMDATSFKVCGQFDTDSCLEFASQPCATGLQCVNGECKNPAPPSNNPLNPPRTQSCGNNFREGTEVCDGLDLNGQSCQSKGFGQGQLRCLSNCMGFEFGLCSTCGDQVCQLAENPLNCSVDCAANVCGNHLREGNEVCDSGDLNGQSCVSRGFVGGTLACNPACNGFITVQCTTCGNNSIEGNDVCDGIDLDGETCLSQGYTAGSLSCQTNCQGFNTNACTTCGNGTCQNGENSTNCPADCPSQTCGNGLIEGSEICDGTNLNGATCTTIPGGYTGGTLTCNSTCTGYVTTACTQSQCGNNVCDNGENHSNCPADCSDYILSYWPLYIGRSTDDPAWNQYKTTISQLKNSGYTHVGILAEGDDVGTPLSTGRINELRSLGHQLAFAHRPGASNGINDIDTLDPEPPITLPDGRVLPNAKYLDIPNLIPSTCVENKHYKVTDPSYTGPVWQLEKGRLTNYMNSANPQNNDLVYFDLEIWGDRINNAFPSCNVSTQLMNSHSRYTAPTEEERKRQWFTQWKNRALDLYQIVKNKNNQTLTLFYHENLEHQSSETSWFSKKTDGSYNNYSTAVPFGSGDLRSPSNYRNPAVVYYNEQFQTYDYAGSVLWISFNCSRAPGLNCDQDVFWNPRISQKIGYLGKQEGLKGIMIYPGPYGWASHGVTIEYFMAHAQALADGFVRGIDAPEISATLNCSWNGSSWSDPICNFSP